jgi:hypothetical protein
MILGKRSIKDSETETREVEVNERTTHAPATYDPVIRSSQMLVEERPFALRNYFDSFGYAAWSASKSPLRLWDRKVSRSHKDEGGGGREKGGEPLVQ